MNEAATNIAGRCLCGHTVTSMSAIAGSCHAYLNTHTRQVRPAPRWHRGSYRGHREPGARRSHTEPHVGGAAESEAIRVGSPRPPKNLGSPVVSAKMREGSSREGSGGPRASGFPGFSATAEHTGASRGHQVSRMNEFTEQVATRGHMTCPSMQRSRGQMLGTAWTRPDATGAEGQGGVALRSGVWGRRVHRQKTEYRAPGAGGAGVTAAWAGRKP